MKPMPISRFDAAALLGSTLWAALVVAGFGEVAVAAEAADAAGGAATSHAERMAALGWIRYRGAWRTAQEIELIERAEATAAREREWTKRLGRLRGQLDRPATSERASEEIREISDPDAVPALAAAVTTEPVFQVRAWYVESLSRIRSVDAVQTLASLSVEHPDPETRFAAVERLVVIGPAPAVPRLIASLASGDPARINRAAEALGRLGGPAAIPPLVAALETRQVATAAGPPPGSTSATFSPTGGGGLSLGGGPQQQAVTVRNERVREALVTLTGVDFGWDAAAWRTWFAAERQPPPEFDPRRG